MKLNEDIIYFLSRQGYVIVSTLDKNEHIHCAAKGIVGIETDKIFVIDLFKNKTYKNLKLNPKVSVTAVNEHEFKGYTFQGQGKIIHHKDIADSIVKKWEDRIIERISSRMIKGVQKGVKSVRHFEAHLPHVPKYLIEIDIEHVIDLAPPSLKQ